MVGREDSIYGVIERELGDVVYLSFPEGYRFVAERVDRGDPESFRIRGIKVRRKWLEENSAVKNNGSVEIPESVLYDFVVRKLERELGVKYKKASIKGDNLDDFFS